MIAPVFRILLLFTALVVSAQAQLAATLRLDKRQYVAGEPVTATITITNHSGRDLTFGSSGRLSWLDFIVSNHKGHPLTPFANPTFGVVTIGTGQTMSRQVNLSSMFPLNDAGNFAVVGVVRMPGDARDGATTNRVAFYQAPGRRYWSQKVGLPGRSGETREFRVLIASDGKKNHLYSQVVNDRNGLPIRTFPMGPVLTSRSPMVTIDNQQRMHVLFLANPSMWVHALVAADGQLLDRKIHQRGPQGDPKLMAYPDGSVAVSNSIPFDPEAAAAERARMRRISDRPAFVYE
jgi:hypothetical protein